MSRSNNKKIYVKDLCLTIKSRTMWSRPSERKRSSKQYFLDLLKEKPIENIKGFTKHDFLKILGDINLENYSKGKDSFVKESTEKIIYDKIKNLEREGKVKICKDKFSKKNVRIDVMIRSIQNWLKRKMGEGYSGELFVEQVGNKEYRVNIFFAEGPRGEKKYFYSTNLYEDIIPDLMTFRRTGQLVIREDEEKMDIQEAFKTILWQKEYSPLLTSEKKQFLIDNLNLGEEETIFNWSLDEAKKLTEISNRLKEIGEKVKEVPNLNTLFLYYSRTNILPFSLFKSIDDLKQFQPRQNIVSKAVYRKLRYIYLEMFCQVSLHYYDRIHSVPIILEEMEELAEIGREKAWVQISRLRYLSETRSLNPENASSIIESIAHHHPGYQRDVRFLWAIGRPLLVAGILDQFEKILEMLRALDEDSAQLVMYAIELKKSNYKAEETIINNLKELCESDRFFIKLMAMAEYAKIISFQNPQKALKLVEEGCEIFNMPYLRILRIELIFNILLTSGSYDAALEIINRMESEDVLHLPPSQFANFYVTLSSIYSKTNQRQKALECIDKALEFFGSNQIYSNITGVLKGNKSRMLIDKYMEKEELKILEDAEKLVKESLELLSDLEVIKRAKIWLAWIHLLKGEYSDFEKIFEDLLEGASEGKNINIEIEKARVLSTSNRLIQAQEHINKILPQITDIEEITQAYGVLYDIAIKKKDYLEALNICQSQLSRLSNISDENKRFRRELELQKMSANAILIMHDDMIINGKIDEAKKLLDENTETFTYLLPHVNKDERCRKISEVYLDRRLEKLLSSLHLGELSDFIADKELFEKAYHLSEGEFKAKTALLLGTIERNSKRFDYAKKYLNEALTTTNPKRLGLIHCELGAITLWEDSLHGDRLEIAKDHFEKAIALFPEPQTYRLVAQHYNQWGHTEEAAPFIAIAEKMWRTAKGINYSIAEIEVLIGSAYQLLLLERYEECIEQIEKGLKLKLSPYKFMKLADWKLECLIKLKRIDDAEQFINAITKELSPESPEIFLVTVCHRFQQLYIARNQPEKALEIFRDYYSRLSNRNIKFKLTDRSIHLYSNTKALNEIFLCSYDVITSKETVKSRDFLHIAANWIKRWGETFQKEKIEIPISEQDSRLLFLYGLLCLERYVPEKAVMFLEKASSLGENHWFLKLILADAYRMAGKYEQAEKRYRELLSVNIPDFFIETCLANTLALMDRPDEAEEIFRELQMKEGKDMMGTCIVNRSFGNFLLRYRLDYKGAKQMFKEELDINPKYPVSWFLFSTSSYLLGEIDEAFRSISKALEIKPKSPFYLHNLAHILEKMEKPLEAVKTLEKALELDPSATHGYCYLNLVNKLPLNIDTKDIMERMPKDFKPDNMQYGLVCGFPELKHTSA